MFGDILDRLADLFPDGGLAHHHDDYHDFMSGMEHSGIDLSMYSADEIKEAMKAAMDADDGYGHSASYGHDISFGAASDVDARNMAKSTLITKLGTFHIYPGYLTTDSLWGGLDSYSGDKVYDAINNARDHNNISDSVYRELIALLKKACHTQ